MKTLLVATDGSEPSLKGVRAAVEVSKGLGLRMELVYVIPPVLLPAAAYADTINKLDEGNRAYADEVLQKAKKVVVELGADADTVMLNGAPAEALCDLSKADRVWGLVIGAKGHGAVARVLLGSVADRLVHICTKPVLVVR